MSTGSYPPNPAEFNIDDVDSNTAHREGDGSDHADVAANTAKETNATHTGEVTGSEALAADKTIITNKDVVTAEVEDHLILADASDDDNLKRAKASDFIGAGSAVFLDSTFRVQHVSDPTKETAFDASAITTATTRTISMPDNDVNLDDLKAIGLISGDIVPIRVTVNGGDISKVDISAGTGIIVDWTTPSTVTYTTITFAGVTALTLTNLATADFTSLYIDNLGVVQQLGGTEPTPQIERQNVVLDIAIHPDRATVTDIGATGNPAYQTSNALLDYIRKLGPINTGNGISAASTDLTIEKAAGTTTFPFINKNVDAQNPVEQTNPLESPVVNFDRSFRDGVGGYNPTLAVSVLDPEFYDDGSGTLAAMDNNKWQIKRAFFFGQADEVVITYGQAQYMSLEAAKDNIFIENPDTNPKFAAGKFITAIIIVKGATDLSDPAEVEFVDIVSLTSVPGSSTQTFQDTYNISGASPQVTASLGPIGLKSGGTDTDSVFEVFNATDTKNFEVTGEGQVTIGGQAFSSLNTLAFAATIATDCSLGNVHSVTLTGDATLGAPTNLKAGATYIWNLDQDGTGGHIITYNSIFIFPAGSIISLSTAALAKDTLTGVYDGTNIRCQLSKEFIPE